MSTSTEVLASAEDRMKKAIANLQKNSPQSAQDVPIRPSWTA